MLSKNLKVIRYAGAFLFVAVLCSVFAYPFLRGESAPPNIDDLQKQMEQVKAEIESKGNTPALASQYSRLETILSKCGVFNQVSEPTIKDPFAPTASLCINGALANTDPSWNRPATNGALPGVGASCPTAAFYDVYSFNLTGCTAFPTEVTITLCGPAGCLPLTGFDTTLWLYRNVPAGDPLTANGGLPAVFNPGSCLTNARGGHDSLNGGVSSTSPTGATCNQVSGACLGACGVAPATGLSGMRRQLGRGRFTVVVSGFDNLDLGSYNLFVNAPAAGCNVALAPTSANANISGRVVTSTGQGIAKATITLSGGSLDQPITLRTNGFGYYNFSDLPVGENYVVSVASKQYSFANPTKVINLEDNVSDADFVSEQ